MPVYSICLNKEKLMKKTDEKNKKWGTSISRCIRNSHSLFPKHVAVVVTLL